MRFNDIETLEDAKAYLRGRESVKREALRMLCKQFEDADGELYDFVREHGITIVERDTP